MSITSLRFTNVGPFDDIEFEFDPQVNVFTGPNNSGKSTALIVLADIVVFPFDFPTKLLRAVPPKFKTRVLTGLHMSEYEGGLPMVEGSKYGVEAHWNRHVAAGPYADVLEGLGYSSFIPAVRQSTDFRTQVPKIERDRGGRPRLPYDDLPELERRRALISTDASLVSDGAVVQEMIELDYRAYRQNDPAIREIIKKIAQIASEITEGFPIQFLGVGEDERGLFPQFQTPDGTMPLNVLSQGTQSIIQWLAHLLIGYAQYYDYPPNLEEKPGILIIDEIDAHLHPSWQRRIIPTLTKHFPNLQIFCSTHSPLMLAGLKAGQVQLLRRDEKGKVTVSRNEDDIKGWSADEILRNVLDVLSPTDLETVKLLNRLQELQHKESLSEDEAAELETLRHTVSRDLLSGPIAGQVDRLADMLKQIKAEFAAHPEQPALAARRGATRRRSRPAK